MRKKLLLPLAASTAIMVSAASIDNRPTAIPAYLTPRSECTIDINNIKPVRPTDHKVPAKKTQTPKTVRIEGTALDLSRAKVSTVDTVLVTSFDYIYDSGDSRNYSTITYDEYGWRKTLTNEQEELRYTYTADDCCRWLSRTVESSRIGENTWQPLDKQERTIENDRVTSVTTYDIHQNGNNEKTFYKDHYYELSYKEGYEANWSNSSIKDAVITREISYLINGDVNSETAYTWIEAANEYFMTYSLNNYSKMESEILDDRICSTTYYREAWDSDNWTKTQYTITYFGQLSGKITTSYDESGSVTGQECSVYESYTEPNGNKVRINYEYIDGSLVPESKTVMSPDYFNETDYSADFNKEYTSYTYHDGEWSLELKSVISHRLLPNGLSEITETYNSISRHTVCKIEAVTDGDYTHYVSYPVTIASDGSYIITKPLRDDNGNDTGYIYEYYSADNTPQKYIKQESFGDIQDAIVFSIMIPGENVWSPLDEHTVTSSEGSISLRTVYHTNANGLPASITEYTTHPSYNGGNEFKSSETRYSYGSNGDFRVEFYELLSPRDLSKMYLSRYDERVTLADGTIQNTRVEYNDNGNGKIDYGTRLDFKDYVTRYYTYNTSSDSWVFSDAYCDTETYVTADGVTVSIMRELSDDNQTAIPTYKYEQKDIDGDENGGYGQYMSASYEWDSDSGKWIGSYKEENISVSYTFECIPSYKLNPLEAYNDEYMILTDNDNTPSYENYISENNRYEWDDEAGNWICLESHEVSADITGNVLTLIRKKTETDNDGIVRITTDTSIKERDAENREIRSESIVEISTIPDDGYGFRSHEITSSTYNDQNGLLAEQRIEHSSGNDAESSLTIARYTYTEFTISGINDTTADIDSAITISGRTVNAPGQTIRIYTTGGILLSVTTDTAVLPDAAGLYIVKAGDYARKVAVR